MTKPATTYSWQPLRTLNASQERTAQTTLKETESHLEKALAKVHQLKTTLAYWQEQKAVTRGNLRERLNGGCSVTELKGRAAFIEYCNSKEHHQLEKLHEAEHQARLATKALVAAKDSLHTAHAHKKASDRHYEIWLQQQRKRRELSSELEQEEQYTARSHFPRPDTSGPK